MFLMVLLLLISDYFVWQILSWMKPRMISNTVLCVSHLVAVFWPTPAFFLINSRCFQWYCASILVDLIVKQWNHKCVKSISNLRTYGSYSDYTDRFFMLEEKTKTLCWWKIQSFHTHIFSTDGAHPWRHTWTLIITSSSAVCDYLVIC